jgi:hypothetical protein
MGRRDGDDVVSAVGEAVTNGLQHGTPPVRPGQPTSGPGCRCTPRPDTDPGQRRLPPAASKANLGYGLWIARQLADVVTTHTDRDRTTITLDFPLAPRG